MIYDCFMFNNEIDILDIRLNVQSEFVDKFVLVESPYTFTGIKKKLWYNSVKDDDRFKKFKGKIEHVILPKLYGDTPWERETFNRNGAVKGLTNLKDDDIIIYSDADEIINPEMSNEIMNTWDHSRLELLIFWYYLNYRHNTKVLMNGPALIRGKDFTTMQDIRRPLYNEGEWYKSPWVLPPIKNAGWHFTYLGGVENIKSKIEAFSHQEFNNEKYNTLDKLQKRIDNFEHLFNGLREFHLVDITDMYPKYIRDNMSKFKHLIKEL